MGSYSVAIAAGDVVACAAEGVWGLSCDPFNHAAVQQLLQLKRRDSGKGLILVAGSLQQCHDAMPFISDEQLNRVEHSHTTTDFVTWLVHHNQTMPSWLTGGGDKVAIRLTRQPALADLCLQCGSVLVSTSANPSGSNPAMTMQQVADYFPQLTIVPSDVLADYRGRVSQLRDLQTGDIVVNR